MTTTLRGNISLNQVAQQIKSLKESFSYQWKNNIKNSIIIWDEKDLNKSIYDKIPSKKSNTEIYELVQENRERDLFSKLKKDIKNFITTVSSKSELYFRRYGRSGIFNQHFISSTTSTQEEYLVMQTRIYNKTLISDINKGMILPSRNNEFVINSWYYEPKKGDMMKKDSGEKDFIKIKDFYNEWIKYRNEEISEIQKRLL